MEWLERLAPDVTATLRRFPFAIVLTAIGTAVALVSINDLTSLSAEDQLRWLAGFATAAVCATAGTLFRESRPAARVAGLLLTYALPVLVVAAFQVRDAGWLFPVTLPVAALLWLSVSPVTRIGSGSAREEQQNRFWWMNSQAIATAAVAGAGFAIIFIGILAIERSLSFLFGLDTQSIFFEWVLPVVGGFLTPVYWLSTIPKTTDAGGPLTGEPEFVGTAIGFLGQFVLVPLLFIYAAILLAYTAQIAATRSLPQGTIGWMVLGFVVAGAATWLVLHAPFMRERGIVRLFRRWWFWLTLIPLALFAVAVWVRVDAYGLTTERMLLIAGGVWAALLVAVFLIGRGDIRLIPALAGAILLLLAVGPWNIMALPHHNQGARLSQLLADSDPTSSVAVPDWDEAQVSKARSAIFYLSRDEHGREVLRQVLLGHGIVYDVADQDVRLLMAKLGYPDPVDPALQRSTTAIRSNRVVMDVTETPYLLGRGRIYGAQLGDGVVLALEDGELVVTHGADAATRVPLAAWVDGQEGEAISDPWIEFTLSGRRFRFLVDSATWHDDPTGNERQVVDLNGGLYSDQPGAAGAMPTP